LFIIARGAILAIFGGILASVFGIFSGLFFVGLVVGILTLLDGFLMVALPSAHSLWGIVAIVCALVSIPFAFGGFVLGFLFALIGGILAILWHPPRPFRGITVEARVVP